MAGFPPQHPGTFYLTEGGQETEIQYRYGHHLPEFAMYPLLESPAAMADLKEMYRQVLDVAAEHGFVALLSGLDYRGSPDWGEKLGYSRNKLADALERSIGFLREVAQPYHDQIVGLMIGGHRTGILAQRYPHIDIFGGCCGTWATHLHEMARNVRKIKE